MRTIGANTTDDNWDQYVKVLQQGLNSTIHKAINAVPSEVLLGYRLRTDNDALAPNLDNENITDVTALRKTVEENIISSAQYNKNRFDKSRTKAKIYKKGSLVVIKIPSQSNEGQSRKLLPIYKGPFKVTKVLEHDRYEVMDLRGSERSQKPYTGVVAAENMKAWICIDDWDTE